MDFEKQAQLYPFDLSLVSFEAEDREYLVAFKDYPDIIGSGASATEAINEAYGNLAVYLEYLTDEGKAILPPSVKDQAIEPSGRVTLRMTKTLHAALIKRSEKENMSVNSVINDALARYLYSSTSEAWGPAFYSFRSVNLFQEINKFIDEKSDPALKGANHGFEVEMTKDPCHGNNAAYKAA